VMQKNLGHRAEADQYYKEAMQRMSHMTDREKYSTRAGYYLMTRNDDKALDECSNWVKEYPADTKGLANLALVHLYRRDLQHAVEEGRRSSDIYPKNVLWRDNLALYMMYAGDFSSAEREAAKVIELNPAFDKAYVATALSQLAQGQVDKARETWKRLAPVDKRGASWSAEGLADIALYQGHLTEAAGILEKAIADDDRTKETDSAAINRLALASARLSQSNTAAALTLAERAIAQSKEVPVRLMAARLFIQAHKPEAARKLAEGLALELDPEARSHARLIDGEIELEAGKASTAIGLFVEAQKLTDTWLVHFLLGQAFLAAESYSDAVNQFDTCIRRRGEATALFLDEIPTYRYFPPVYYYKGRAEEALHKSSAVDSYRAYLSAKSNPEADALATDAARRIAGLSK
jgi:hypothetical protein